MHDTNTITIYTSPHRTQAHFGTIIQTLAESRPPKGRDRGERHQWEITVAKFGAMFTNINPNFNHKEYLDAVGWDLDK